MSGIGRAFADLATRVSELERRQQNRLRTGVVAEADAETGLYRVRLREASGDQPEMLSPPIPIAEIGAGAVRVHLPASIGEQVVLISETGDLTDAAIIGRLPSDANPRAHDQLGEVKISIGATELLISAAGVTIKAGAFRVEGDSVLDGEVDLGGAGGAPVHLKGQRDDDGDKAVEGASKVRAK